MTSNPPVGEKGKARDILAAIRTLKHIEAEDRPATSDERDILARFGGFGPVAHSLFPNPGTGQFKDPGWKFLGEELKSALTEQEYDSARRTVFNAFYTSPTVVEAMHSALKRLGTPDQAVILEPGCGTGNFLAQAAEGQRFLGIEMDSLSGRIARALHPEHEIRIENFRDSKLPPVDAVIGNVPFADLKLSHDGHRFALHDYFFAKSVDALKPGGVLALVTSHFTMDKQNAEIREHLSDKADFLGAIRLPSDAFKREGTAVVTDIVFLRKRAPGEVCKHCDPEWIQTSPLCIEGTDVAVNRYFHNHPEMVLGTWSRKDTLYGEGLSVLSNGDLAAQLREAVERLPSFSTPEVSRPNPPPRSGEFPVKPGELSAKPGELLPAFVPPPPLQHVTEGSFFVGDDRIVRQVENGIAEPVTYCGTLLRADGTPNARKFCALIGLRDKARNVLRSQNEGWPEANRNGERASLRHAYDQFVAQYGPINKTTFTQGKTGTIRRMPNLVKFKEDPDAMLVMSLEEYDEATGKAEKSPIMLRDVVGPKPPLSHVSNAEEGLLASLDHKGTVDLGYIASLYGKPEAAIVQELGDLIYHDPSLKTWQTADAYLSGNVREKLKEAQRAGPKHAANAEALLRVQPEDVLPGDIDANLGAPWIPVKDIEAFAATLFGEVKIGHLERDAVWTTEPSWGAQQSVAATAEFGTPRINGISLFEQALNLKSPIIYDTIFEGGREVRVANQEATLAAKEKQKQIKERFRSWVFADPERTERLVRLYNDTYNNLRPRLFDGSHLEFPGMSRAITLKPHQEDAVWRCMSGGNTLLAHTVGAGKTYEMCAAAMKMKQAGLIKKPLIAVPNHMLEQFAREWMQLYPNAKLLIASKEDMGRDRRKYLTARIASGDWDGIIVTHSSFERIGMSRDFQEKFLREQIAEYDHLLVDKAAGSSRNIIKIIEKQKARREERLKDLLAEDKKDDGLVFDELGVDQVFIDEFQAYKNLETPTKMERVAGIPSGGSERAFDLYMKACYLDQQHPDHGLVGASGTPISNSMAEMYTVQKFFDPAGLRSRGIEHFDAWAATFGEVVDAMEISPDGATLKARSRFAKFINLPELVQMFRAFSDVQTAEMLNLPRPELEGGKPHIVSCPMSERQRELQGKLVERYERIRNERVDPREDNALAITTDGRKLALDARMLAGDAGDFPESKINALVGNVAAIWEKTKPTRGTQMIFCDMGVNPTPWGYSAYDEVVCKLIGTGIPRDQIAVMGDADSDARKQALFERVRAGSVRVLIGSTQKMGTGTNVQKRLVALHHLDAPWKPAEVEQREGRILRQGNTNKEVSIFRYVTEGSFDAYMWQALETKARFINQVMAGDGTARTAEDIGGQELSYAEVKAIASGNPAVLTLAEADAEMQRLAVLKRNHADEQYLARRSKIELPGKIERLERRIAALTADQATAESNPAEMGMEGISRRLNAIPELVREQRSFQLGIHRGLKLGLTLYPSGAADVTLEGQAIRSASLSRESQGARAILNAAGRIVHNFAHHIEDAARELEVAQGQLRDHEARLGMEFAHDAYMQKLGDLRHRLKVALSDHPAEGELPASEISERIKALRASVTVEAAPQRARKASSGEQPVTARIRRTKPQHPAEAASPPSTEDNLPRSQESAKKEEKPEPPPEPFALETRIVRQPEPFKKRVVESRKPEKQMTLW